MNLMDDDNCISVIILKKERSYQLQVLMSNNSSNSAGIIELYDAIAILHHQLIKLKEDQLACLVEQKNHFRQLRNLEVGRQVTAKRGNFDILFIPFTLNI